MNATLKTILNTSVLSALVIALLMLWPRYTALRRELAQLKDDKIRLAEDNQRLKTLQKHEGVSERPNVAELLRLRGEVGVLRRQVIELSTKNAGPSAPQSVTVDVSSPYSSLSNLFTAIHLTDARAVRQFLSPGSPLLRRSDLDEVLAATLEKIQSVSIYVTTNVAFAVSDPLPDRNGQTALLFEIRNVEGKWLLHKVRESDLSYIEERLQSLSQQSR